MTVCGSDLRVAVANSERPLNRDELIGRIDQLQKAISALRDTLIPEIPPSISPSTAPRSELPFNVIGTAYAQAVAPPSPPGPAVQPPITPRRFSDAMRTWIMVLVFIVLGITFIISIVAIFKTNNPEVLKFAFDTVKTLLGFFIGVATTLIGTS